MPTLEWSIGHLILNTALFALAVMLYRRAPCWIQKTVMVLFVVAFWILAAGYGMYAAGVHEIARFGKTWMLLNIGYYIEHMAVALYVFRIILHGGLNNGSGASSAVHS